MRTMNAIFHGEKDVYIWCYGNLKENLCSKDSTDNSELLPSKTKTKRMMTDVGEIIDKLRSKHGSKYTVEKYSAWAYMIHLKKYTSYDDNIPDMPYFNGRKPPSSTIKAVCSCTGTQTLTRIQQRSECIDQLRKWHALMEEGVIMKEQYDSLKSEILSDML